MKLGIIGSRNYDDYAMLCQVLVFYLGPLDLTEIISGGAKGADSLGARYANDKGIKLTEFLPDWDKYGKRAGFIRNEDIVKNADFILVFWDGVSKGTGNSLSIAKRLKKPTFIIYF